MILLASAGAGRFEPAGEALRAPCYLRSHNVPKLRAQAWLTFYERHGIIPSRIRPGKPWQNGAMRDSMGRFGGNV